MADPTSLAARSGRLAGWRGLADQSGNDQEYENPGPIPNFCRLRLVGRLAGNLPSQEGLTGLVLTIRPQT